MRYRRLDAAGDMNFGHAAADFLVDSPDAVGQAVMTRLRLFRGEWFLDTTEGTQWTTRVLGRRTQGGRDAMIRARILETADPAGRRLVTEIVSYESQLTGRTFTVNARINTVFGQAVVRGAI